MSAGSKQFDMPNSKSSVAKSVGRLSVTQRRINDQMHENANKTCGAMTAMNGKNFYAAPEICGKKQSRDKNFDCIGLSNTYGKKKSINSGGAKPGNGSRGSRGLS